MKTYERRFRGSVGQIRVKKLDKDDNRIPSYHELTG